RFLVWRFFLALALDGSAGARLAPFGSGGALAVVMPLPFVSRVGSVIETSETSIENWPLDARAYGTSRPRISTRGRCPGAQRQALALSCQSRLVSPSAGR